jgi:VWFA-related protein
MKAAALAFPLLIAPMVFAQQTASGTDGQSQDDSLFTLKQEVRNVVVDVVAIDKNGEPVKTLDKSRFRVMENGVAQSVSFFEEHTEAGETASAAPLPPKGNHLAPNEFTNVENAPAGGPLLVLLLDAMNTRRTDQAYVRAQVLDYLKHIPAGSHMAIFTLADKLQLVQGFTADPAVLKAALSNRAYPTSSTITPQGLSSGSIAGTRSSLSHFANETESFSQELRTRYTIDALNALSVYLAGILGRKSLIWFAGSIPWTINPDFSLVTSVTGRVDYSDEIKKLADAMQIGRISIYPVDARGLVTPPGYAADQSPGLNASSVVSNRGGTGRESGANFARSELNSQMNLAGSHMSMSNLAAATGGRAFYNTNGLSGAVTRVQSIGENYYTFAYSPTDKRYDGGFRELKITVDDPRIRLEYRRGYFAEDPMKATGRTLLVSSNPLRGVMQRGAPGATQIPFRVRVEVAAKQPDPARPADRIGDKASSLKGAVVRYDFHWTVDLNSVKFTPTGNGEEHGEVDATLTAYDVDGNQLNDIYSELPLDLPAANYDRFLKSGLPMKQTLDLPAGMVFLRAGVLDPSDGHTGATEFPFVVGAPAGHASAHAANAAGQM